MDDEFSSLFLPENEDFSIFSGYICFDDHQFALRIEMKEPPLLKGASISVCHELQSFLGMTGIKLLKTRFKNAKILEHFMVELKDLIERAIRERNENQINKKTIDSSLMCAKLVEDLDEGLWDNVVWIDASLKAIQISFQDNHKRNHVLHLNIPNNYPISAPLCNTLFPEVVDIHWNHSSPSTSSIRYILSQYISASDKYNELWHNLEDIDTHCWVIEPENPSYAIVMRRIALGNQCSLHIELDPKNPHRMPECKFLGSENIVSSLRSKIHSNFKLWNNKKLVRENLQVVLELEFPKKQAKQLEEETFDCSICYTYRLGDQIPDRVCDNTKCKRAYHSQCLYEWLRSASTRQSFDTMFGNCPYCTEPITVKVV